MKNTLEKIKETYTRIKDVINRTPVMTSTTLDRMTGARCFLKLESFQKTGSFKFRGAYNAITSLSEQLKKKGVTTHSSGNHAQALSLASKIAGTKAVVVMPKNAPKIKILATKGYGAEVVFCGTKPKDREKATQKLINNMDIIYGQSTSTYELINEVETLDFVFAPCGGGGLLSGTALAAKAMLPHVNVIGVEPKNADDAYRSIRDGKIYPSLHPNTIADGLRTSLGTNTFKIIRKKVDKIITVKEEEIVNAMEFLWTRMKLVVEPSGAVSLAGVLEKSGNNNFWWKHRFIRVFPSNKRKSRKKPTLV
ncbi:MAG: threonine/serine dehydratase [Candidatus Heimdallarchaeaceae archaeon]